MLMNVQLTMVDVITSATIQPGALSADVSLDTHWPQMVERAMVRKAPALSECSFLLTYTVAIIRIYNYNPRFIRFL